MVLPGVRNRFTTGVIHTRMKIIIGLKSGTGQTKLASVAVAPAPCPGF
jgi:hypothetical protein